MVVVGSAVGGRLGHEVGDDVGDISRETGGASPAADLAMVAPIHSTAATQSQPPRHRIASYGLAATQTSTSLPVRPRSRGAAASAIKGKDGLSYICIHFH